MYGLRILISRTFAFVSLNGLSILIPIYNRDVKSLVSSLISQCEAAKLQVEVLCYDDHSDDQFKNINAPILNHKEVVYQLLPYNHGRSKIRNKLACDAKYDILLFLDCDSLINNDFYIKKYIDTIKANFYESHFVVIYGGTTYQETLPNPNHLLHWHYGRKVEAQKSTVRSKDPYQSFKTNNFIVYKKVFDEVQFDESIITYGYEDSMFAKALELHKFGIFHCDNEVIHDGIESNKDYIKKIGVSIENLKRLKSQGQPIETRLTMIADKLKYYKFDKIIKYFQPKLELLCIFILTKWPSAVFFLQCWKLLRFLK